VDEKLVFVRCMQAVKDAGLAIPEDISIVGFGDDLPSWYVNPHFTTVTNPASSLGAAAACLLISVLQGHAALEPPPALTMLLAARESWRPEIFLRAAKELGVAVACSVGVEDSQAGIHAIVNGGIFAVGIWDQLHGAHWLLRETGALTFEGLCEKFRAWSLA
jgi:hypothetical protein